MKLTGFINLLFCMQLSYPAIAQHPEIIDWSDATQLPLYQGKPHPGLAGPVTGIHNNILIIAGGANFPEGLPWEGGKKKYHSAVYLYDLSSGKPDYLSTVDDLSKPLAYSASCNTPQGIVTAGGENSEGLSNAVYLLSIHPVNHSLTIKSLPSLPVPTTNAVAVASGASLYFIGGETAAGTTAACWKLEMNHLEAGWKSIAPLPMPLAYASAVLMEIHDHPQLVVLGGRRKTATGISEIVASVYVYELSSDKWEQKPSLPFPVSAGLAVAADQSTLFFLGGDKAETFTKVEQTLAAIAAAAEADKPALINTKNKLLSTHPGFSKDVLSYDVETGQSATAGMIPFPSPVTTTALLYQNKLIIPSGEIRAGVRTPAVLTATIKLPKK
jgi:N-acetylneuraminic acid mutarotase